jgi:hypothetical protein
LVHADIGARIHGAKVVETEKFSVLADQRIAEHSEVTSRVANASLILGIDQ